MTRVIFVQTFNNLTVWKHPLTPQIYMQYIAYSGVSVISVQLCTVITISTRRKSMIIQDRSFQLQTMVNRVASNTCLHTLRTYCVNVHE